VLNFSPAVKLGYCPDAVDRRLGFDGLFALVRNRLQADPLSGHLFIFRNRSANRLKVLYGGGHGLCLWCQKQDSDHPHSCAFTEFGGVFSSLPAIRHPLSGLCHAEPPDSRAIPEGSRRDPPDQRPSPGCAPASVHRAL